MTQTKASEIDAIDAAIRDERVAAWNRKPGPRVGDFCLMPDGTLRRFTYDLGDLMQTTSQHFGFGSFYLADGWMDYSGALDPGLPKTHLEETDHVEFGAAWFFHHDETRAHNAVAVSVPCRVYALKQESQRPHGASSEFTRVAA